MDAKCPECDLVAVLNDECSEIKCPHCNFKSSYDDYIEIMKDKAINMSADYIPDRPGF